MKIAVDAMGGDRAPRDVVEGVSLFSRERTSQVILVGDESQIRREMARLNGRANFDSVSLHHASQVIAMGEPPAQAVKHKKDASLVVAARLVREMHANAMISMGNTGACMAAALLEMGRLEGVQRPGLPILIPHHKGSTVLIDAGANIDCRPSHLVQFAAMGEIYAEQILGIQHPRVGLLNVGEEEGKGNELVQETYGLLRQAGVNFIGNVEGGDLTNGRVDVVVCDGFVGNVVLKNIEGVALAVIEMIKDAYRRGGYLAQLGAILSKPAFRLIKKRMDPAAYGGTPLLGVNGTCIIGHGSSSPWAVSNAVGTAGKFVELRINHLIRERIAQLHLPRGGHG